MVAEGSVSGVDSGPRFGMRERESVGGEIL